MKNLFKALAKFQQEVPVIHKGTQGYGYSYADLPAIFGVINPLMAKHGLGFTQLMEGQSLRTTIFHIETGEDISSVTDIPQNVTLKGQNQFQVLGSAITYIRRYALSSALGLVTDKDTDAGGEQVSKPKEDTRPWLTEDGFKYLKDQGSYKEIQTAIKDRRMKRTYREELDELLTKTTA